MPTKLMVDGYRYGELNDKAKEHVRNMIGQWFDSLEFSYQCKEYIEELGWTVSKDDKNRPALQYSLGYCQSDGLSFSGKVCLNKYIPELGDFYYACSRGNTGRYCYASEDHVEFYSDDYLEDGVYQEDISEETKILLQDALEMAKSDYTDICHELMRRGYSEIEYQYSEEYAKDTCDANDYWFDCNGKILHDYEVKEL